MKLSVTVRSAVCFAALFVLFSCQGSPATTPKKEGEPVLKFIVSSSIQSYLPDLNPQRMNASPVEAFEYMRSRSDAFCEQVWKGRRPTPDLVPGFVTPAAFEKEGPFANLESPVPKLMAGCWNFFKMNDTRPDLDFAPVMALFPKEKKECFSVGLIQPYLMHSLLDCKTLTMLDIDWRIIDAHRQILALYVAEAMKDEASLTASVTTLNLGWSARFDGRPMEKRLTASLDALCFAGEKSRCVQTLLTFQKKYSALESVRLQISSLHEADYSIAADSMGVVFLSNAIEDLYTPPEQFALMMENIQKTMRQGQRMLFVHHAAGRAQFGLYVVEKADQLKVTTLCKDNYLSSPVGTVYPYRTHFDRISETKAPPLCAGWRPVTPAPQP